MSTTGFTPERSAAIRQLLIDTVADEPRRRRHLQVLLTSVLSGVAIVLAGGTAALALSGIIHFGGDETPPPPVPTPTQTATPTPTPTPTQTPTAPPLVQSATVQPHDVSSLPARPRWALDLPGDDRCTSALTYTLSDARAVYVSGIRPKEYEGSDCIKQTTEDLAVTLVDTSNGHILWTREWAFSPQHMGFSTQFLVLGTSGRALFSFPEPGTGPHDVLDLATGRTVGTFQPDWSGFVPSRDMKAIPGDAGDVVVVKHARDQQGNTIGNDVVMRADPANLGDPEWTTPLTLRDSDLGSVTPEGTAMTIGGSDQQYVNKSLMLDLETGATNDLPSSQVDTMSGALLSTTRPQPGGIRELTAYGPDGRVAWSRPVSEQASVIPAKMPGTTPIVVTGSRQPDTGELFVVDAQWIVLLDQATGAERWRVATSSCVSAPGQPFDAMLDVRRDAYLLDVGDSWCALGRETGALSAPLTLPGLPSVLFGLTNVYSISHKTLTDPGTAHDLSSGTGLWTHDRDNSEWWTFDGGYLVSHHANHVESIG